MRSIAVRFVSLLSCTLLTLSLVKCIPRRRDNQHYVDDKYNVAHDHKAFLGDDEIETFHQLTPEESKMRLSEIVDKIDKDNDGKITTNELRDWIEYIQLKHFHDEVDRRWDSYDNNDDGKISWAEFKNTSYGRGSDKDDDSRNADKNYRNKREIDNIKWKAADYDNDNMLTKGEYAAFLHPNEYKRMHGAAANEIINAIDQDKDGFISLEEYLVRNSETPKQLDEEKKTFKTERDKDGNGKLNREETMQWLFPVGYNALDAETRHLMSEADANKDKILTKHEILSKQEFFVGSRATNFGETLNRPIDEL